MRNSELLASLSNCINHCNYCADACLEEENVKEMIDCIRTDRVCASVCAATADVLATNYPAEVLVGYCQEICERCAEECKSHEAEHCQKCARACEECARACEKFFA
ncbi:four-helix bundle copper-binding protein [Sinomicrobium pectinilyticum]|uniref:Four-helix bundle copper-binding protein n=2 Tax=Sinomicrobium pectinilyticum TaxID=1084421 RepID=A0A3N0EHI0_SINP1|nr:four-helix bundle copper-binding protein [Sinomicrobium pectinilyticum]